jgi:hypothetical protein
MKKKFLSVLVLSSLMIMASCDGSITSLETSSQTTTEEESTSSIGEISSSASSGVEDTSVTETTSAELSQFSSDITFEDSSFTYDGNDHTISVANVPSFASVKYTKPSSCINVGEYEFEAMISADNYESLTLNATLTITKAELSGITFEDETFDFDSLGHSIDIAGVLPEGSAVSYTCAEDENITNEAVNPGTYTITATITNNNYVTGEYTADLTIKSSDEERYMCIDENTGYLYFQNALDNNFLYNYDSDEVLKVSSDNAQYFTNYQSNVTYVSHGLFSSSIKAIDSLEASTDTMLTKNAQFLCNDGTNLYFAINSLKNSNSGIYMANTFDGESEPTKLFEGKAKFLTYSSGNVYFADGTNGYKLSSLNTSSKVVTQLIDEKISDLEMNGDYLYYTVNNLIAGDYIERYEISSGETLKLTCDAGSDLTYYDGNIYYVNVDLLTSYVFGDGIYKVNADPIIGDPLPGTKVIEPLGDEGVCSLNIFEDTLYYYDADDYGLYSAEITSSGIETAVNILDGFEVPEYTPISMGGKNLAYNNDLYYIDIYNGKCLYKYNSITEQKYKISSNEVVNFDIVGDKLYYNQISYMVDNDLYVTDLIQGGLPVKLSTNDCNDVVSDGTYIYYSEQNEAGANTALHRMDLDGSNDITFYDEGCYNLACIDGKLCFIEGTGSGYIEYINTSEIADGVTLEPVKLNDEVKTTLFKVYNNKIYARRVYTVNKTLVKMDLDGSNEVEIKASIDPKTFTIVNDTIYYYNEVTIGTKGIYSIGIDGSNNTLLIETDTSYFPQDIIVIGDYLYFTNYFLSLGGDSHTYQVNLVGDPTLTQIA